MEYSKIIKERYSVRNFLDKDIEQDKLDKIFEAGRISPTAKNNQPQKIFILKTKESLDKMKNLTKCTYGAPLVLLCCYDKNESWKNNKSYEDSGVEDVSISCTQMMLEAWNQGVGSCWVNMYDSNEIRKEFNLGDNIIPVCLLPMGYISDTSKPIPMHFNKKTKEEMFFEI